MYLNSNKHKNIFKNYNNLNFKKKIFFKIQFYKIFNKNSKIILEKKIFSKKNLKTLKFRYKNLCHETGKYNSIINYGLFKRQIFKNFLIQNKIPRLKKLSK